MPKPVVAVTRKLPNVIETRMVELFEVRLQYGYTIYVIYTCH